MGGQPKGLLEVGGRRIIDRQVEVLSLVADEVLLVGGEQAAYADVRGVRLVRDRHPGKGPLAGLEAALAAAAHENVLVIGCDLPFLDVALLERVRDAAPAAQAVVPRVAGRPQGLHARYARSALDAITARLARNELKLTELLDELAVAWLDEEALRVLDPELRGLTNVNTPEDLERVRRG
jgi:molybdopterin-guanine dinucleotide biosynthesis protein A